MVGRRIVYTFVILLIGTTMWAGATAAGKLIVAGIGALTPTVNFLRGDPWKILLRESGRSQRIRRRLGE